MQTNVAAAVVSALLKKREAAKFLNVSLRTFEDLRARKLVPDPIQLGPRTLLWKPDDLRAAIDSMPRKAVSESEPAQLAAGKAKKKGTA